ncbi:MAG: hypothetical protein K0U93_06855 [Gammaproteobacteria bacterium]|nr:hypothetical protein [Gammaproteobacteria bacterium]
MDLRVELVVVIRAGRVDHWVVGFFAHRHGFMGAPIALALILVEMVETNLQNSLKMFGGQWWLMSTHLLAVVVLAHAVLGYCGPAVLAPI